MPNDKSTPFREYSFKDNLREEGRRVTFGGVFGERLAIQGIRNAISNQPRCTNERGLNPIERLAVYDVYQQIIIPYPSAEAACSRDDGVIERLELADRLAFDISRADGGGDGGTGINGGEIQAAETAGHRATWCAASPRRHDGREDGG